MFDPFPFIQMLDSSMRVQICTFSGCDPQKDHPEPQLPHQAHLEIVFEYFPNGEEIGTKSWLSTSSIQFRTPYCLKRSLHNQIYFQFLRVRALCHVHNVERRLSHAAKWTQKTQVFFSEFPNKSGYLRLRIIPICPQNRQINLCRRRLQISIIVRSLIKSLGVQFQDPLTFISVTQLDKTNKRWQTLQNNYRC